MTSCCRQVGAACCLGAGSYRLSLIKSSVSGASPFPFGNWWLDEKGDIHPWSPTDKPYSNVYFRGFGLIKICVQPGTVAVFWSTKYVEDQSLSSVLDGLAGCDEAIKIQLNYFYHGWVNENCASPPAAIGRIIQIQQNKHVEILHPTMVRTCDIGEIKRATPLIKRAYQIWEHTDGQFSNIAERDISDYLSHVLIFKPDRREEHLIYSWVGLKTMSAKYYGHKWVRDSIGRFSDKSFGVESQVHADQVSVGIARTIKTGEPLLQHFRALMKIDGRPPLWVSYERLLARHTLHDGRMAVVNTVSETQNVSIPLAGGAISFE